MKKKSRWAFILDRDEFVRFSLNKMLKKYGFEVEEVEDFSQLGKRRKEIREGMVLADTEIDLLEQWVPLLKKWNDRFIFMTPLITDELSARLKNLGICHVLKKPVEPKVLRRVIEKISFPDECDSDSSTRQRVSSRYT